MTARARILAVLRDAPATVTEVAAATGYPRAKVNKVLSREAWEHGGCERAGVVRQPRAAPARGSAEWIWRLCAPAGEVAP